MVSKTIKTNFYLMKEFKEGKIEKVFKFIDKYKKGVFFFIIFSVLIYLILSVGGTSNYEENFCRTKVHSNDSNANYILIKDEKGYKCCTEGEIHFYERDEGTMTYFLFGKNGHYSSSYCVDSNDYKKPNIFDKIKNFGEVNLKI